MTPLETVVDRLKLLLRLHGKTPGRKHRMMYKSLPLATDLKFEGTPLRKIMSPSVPETGVETALAFDAWLWPVHEGTGSGEADLTAATSPALCAYVCRGDTFGVQTVRLLYALSSAEGASMAYDETSIMVTHDDKTYGIANGLVVSRFCAGLQIKANPKQVLEDTHDVGAYDKGFTSLYREAYRRGGGAREALIALHMGQPNFSFTKLARESVPKRNPTKADIRTWENVLTSGRDPIKRLYKHLVPLWFKSRDFGRMFCSLHTRPLELDPLQQQAYINKLHYHFYKNKKEEQ